MGRVVLGLSLVLSGSCLGRVGSKPSQGGYLHCMRVCARVCECRVRGVGGSKIHGIKKWRKKRSSEFPEIILWIRRYVRSYLDFYIMLIRGVFSSKLCRYSIRFPNICKSREKKDMSQICNIPVLWWKTRSLHRINSASAKPKAGCFGPVQIFIHFLFEVASSCGTNILNNFHLLQVYNKQKYVCNDSFAKFTFSWMARSFSRYFHLCCYWIFILILKQVVYEL